MHEAEKPETLWEQVREKFSEKLPIWGARTTLAAIAGLLVASFILEIAHKTGALTALKVPEDFVTDALLICTFGLCFFAVEQSAKTEGSVQVADKETDEKFERLEGKLAALQNDVTSSSIGAARAVDNLRRHQMSAIDVVGFAGPEEFLMHWNQILETYPNLTLWGKFGSDFTANFRVLQERGRSCAYYMPIEEDSQDVASAFLSCASAAEAEALKLYETGASGNLSWISGFDLARQQSNVLICFSPLGDARFAGVYMSGAKAWSFYQNVLPRLEARSAVDQNSLPVRIYTQQQIDRVLSTKVSFKRELLEVDKGEVLRGVEEVCDSMTCQLRQSKISVDITHICSEETIALLRAPQFVPWLAANYEAAKHVKITRIFILPKALRSTPLLKEVIAEMRSNEVNVLLCDMEDLDKGYIEDFSIYDDRHVIYIDHDSAGPWVPVGYASKENTVARRSDSRDRVNKYRIIFDILSKKAQKNSVPVRI
ncbi:MAG TPA: hypothetical protein VHX11_02740 [Acidobacteriaceae bacterium]|jgi:hypothetical protein|nr:hypothetical protein [Acidobacteriaceae bacterium]